MSERSNIVFAAALLAIAGCLLDEAGGTAGELGGHVVLIHPPCESVSTFMEQTSRTTRYELTCGERRIQLEHDLLIVNGYEYGLLRPGQMVRISKDGVTVDGDKRKGRQLFIDTYPDAYPHFAAEEPAQGKW